MISAVKTVMDLQREGALLVEDGNHGENRPRKDEFSKVGMAFIRAADMAGYQVQFQSAEKINETAQKRVRKGIGKGGDILISHKGTIGRVARVPQSCPAFVCSPQTTFWRVLDAERIDPDFLFALLRSPQFQSEFAVRAGETDMAGYVSLTSQRALLIDLPDIDLQREIGRTITPIDEKIELNRRMNETLEEMVRALFRDWFVDFGPTHRKMEGATDPAAIMGNAFPPEKAATLTPLFPAKLGDDGLPEGWLERPLDKIGHFLNGLALQKFPAQEGKPNLPVIKIAELRNGVSTKSNRASTEIPEKYVICNGDFIFSWSGSLLAKFWVGGAGALNQHLFKVTSESHPMWFVSECVQTHLEEFQRIAASKAVTMGHIKRSHIAEAMCVCPPNGSLLVFGEVFDPLIAKQIINKEENQTLAEMRDLLLPKLMSGEIRLKDGGSKIER